MMLLLNHSLQMMLLCMPLLKRILYWWLSPLWMWLTQGIKIGNEPRFVDGVPVCDQSVEIVKEFLYLDSTISNDGKVDVDVKIRITKAANTFGYLKRSVFTNAYLSITVKHAVYRVAQLYGSECWAVKAFQLRCLEVFHYCCVRCILGITSHQQWIGYITNDA